MNIEVDTVKGFQDILPPASVKRRAVREAIERYFQLYGFLPLETPLIEFDELMRPDTLQEEDEAVSDRFRLKDRGGRNLGLRYEFTFQLARIFKLNPTLKLPFRRYQIGEVFRDEPVKAGRFRQFTQCDADIIGDSSIDSEAELLAMTRDIMRELSIPATIHVNSRKLIAALIESVQMSNSRAIMRELDKLDKLGEDHVKSNLRKYGDANQILTLFKLLEKELAFFSTNAFDGASELAELEKKCKRYGVSVIVQPTLVRGLGYYTGNIFEVRVEGKGESIAAGGRYDHVAGKYVQRQIPAAGISFGLERCAALAEIGAANPIRVLLISLEKDAHTIKLMQLLRAAGIPCMMMSAKPGKALEYANALSIPYAVFVGEEETARKKYKMRDMQSGEEQYLGEKQLVAALQEQR